MNKKIFKHFLPVVATFTIAFVFFVGYNHYLLDNSLANLKISLIDLEKTKDLSQVKKVVGLLDDSFIEELAKGDFDLTFAVKMEISEELIDKASKEIQEKNKDFTVKLSSAANIEFSAGIAEKISKNTQIEDIKYFVQEAIKKKMAKRPFLLSKIDDIVIRLFPVKRDENKGNLQKEINKLEKALGKYKGNKLQEKYLEIAKLYLLMKDLESAKNYLNKSIEVDGKNIEGLKASFFLGILYKANKDYAKASQIFDAIKSELPKEWKFFAYYQEADCLYRIGEIDKAISLFEELFQMASASEIPQLSQFRAAYAYLYDLKNVKMAVSALAMLMQKDPASGLSSYIKNKIYPDIAWQYCLKGFKLLEEGYKYSEEQKYNDSLAEFNSALEIVPKHSASYIGKGLAFYFLKNPDEAISNGVKAETIDPHNSEVIANLGFIYFNIGMTDRAIEQYNEAIKYYSKSYIYNYNLATLYALKEDYRLSLKYFMKCIEINKKYPYAYNNLGYVLWHQGDYREAKENLKKATAIYPEYVDAHYNLGIVYYTLGDYENAGKEFKQVNALRPKFREVEAYLRQITKKLGYEQEEIKNEKIIR